MYTDTKQKKLTNKIENHLVFVVICQITRKGEFFMPIGSIGEF